MEVTWVGWALTPFALIALAIPLAAIAVLVARCCPQRSLSEQALAATLLLAVGLYAQVQLLSLVPVARPLDWLPVVHGLLTVALVAASLRCDGAWRTAAARWRSGLKPWLRVIGPVGWIAATGAIGLFAVYFAFGMYSTPVQWDELDYHLPMAIQPLHDGRVGPIGGPLPALHYYPRGAELIWFWTLSFTRTDLLFHAVQLAFGAQLMIAMYLLARRTGAAPREALVAGVVLAATPMFYLLTTTGYVDIAHAASAVAVLAYLAPPGRDGPITADWHWAAIAMAEACIVKHPFVAVIFAGAALAQSLGRAPWRAAVVDGLRFFVSWRGAASLVVLAGCAHTYIQHWAAFGNPCYPFRIVIAGVELFPAPHTPNAVNNGGQTSVGKPIAAMSFVERYYHAWTDFNAPLSIESFGSFGPVFAYGLLMPAGVLAIAAVLRGQTWRLAVCLALLVSMLITPAAVPRYGIAVVAVIVVLGASLMSELPRRAAAAYSLLLLVLCVPTVRPTLGALQWWLALARAEGGLSLTERNSFFVEKFEIGAAWTKSLPMIRFIRENVRGGEVLAWNVSTFPTLLLNRDWSNRLAYMPGANGLAWPGPAPGPTPYVPPSDAQLSEWVSELQRIAPRWVLLYADQAYAQRLLATQELGYRVALEDDASRAAHRMILFERTPQ